MTDDRKFVELVNLMRHHQRRWFKYNNRDDLEASKRLEREVDRQLDRELAPRAEPSLFDRRD